jgi:diguanylate cyclase (GGDEF)-like protein/PAS domain S-box-containing protein
MINISPAVRIVLGMLLTLAGLLFLGGTAGLFAGDGKRIEAERDTLTRLLAIHFAAALQREERPAIEQSLRELIAQSPELRSVTLRGDDGELLANVGNPVVQRQGRAGSTSDTGAYHQARMYRDGNPWGSVTARFAPLDNYGPNVFHHNPLTAAIALLVVFPLGGFLLFSGIRYQHYASTSCVPYQVRTALDALAEGVLLLDAEGRILFANAAFANSMEKIPGALLGRKLSDLRWEFGRIHEDEFPWDAVQRLGEMQTGKQLCLVHPSGGVRTFTVNAAPVRDGDRQRGVMVTFDDVTQLEEKNDQLEDMLGMLKKSRNEIRRQNRELQVLATRDPLTNCLNRRSFFEKYEALFDAARRGGQQLACIMVDIDLFKSINDRYGHLKGDEVIRAVAQTLRASLRASDVICRYGGEEFCIILPGVDAGQALATAIRARGNIEAMDLGRMFGHAVQQVTASFGISTIDREVADFAHFIDRADQALYTSKNSGRNRVSVWETQAGDRALPPPTPETGARPGGTSDAVGPAAGGGQDGAAQAACMDRVSLPQHGVLSGLHCRRLFHNRIVETIERCRKNQQRSSLLMLDLDMFRHVNNALGLFAGDELLKEVARRLLGSLRHTDAVARLGEGDPENPVFRLSGDEFGILLTGVECTEFTAEIARRIIDALGEPVVINDHAISLASNIGISLYPENGADADSLLKSAAVALYHAKCQGPNCLRFYHDDELDTPGGDFALEDELRRAFDNNELELHYQPKIDMKSGKVVCMEALLRWRHPEIGMVPPAQFLPVAENTGLILAIGRWVLRTACRQLLAWQQGGQPDLSISVNISPAQFARKDLLMQIGSILDETGIDPWRLELEITESTIMDDIDHAAATLRILHKAGMKICIDDFGTGYSSLTHLRRFPISTVKIDRSFIRDITTDADDAGIIKAIITMAHGMGLRVVAEGVESEAQLAHLAELHCDEFQGFLVSPPVPRDEAGSLLRANTLPEAGERLAS